MRETYEILIGKVAPGRFEEFKDSFVRRADERMLEGIEVYRTVRPALRLLKASGATLAIVSTKFRYRIEDVLLRDGLANEFSVVIGGEDVPSHKPDPSGLVAAMRVLGVAREQTVYVGDSLVDAETARRAFVTFVAVWSGTTAAQEFDNYRPLAILGSLAELPATLGMVAS